MASTTETRRAAQHLRLHSVGVRLSFRWLGNTRTFTDSEKAQAAQAFQADCRWISASQKLLDQRHPRYRRLTQIKGEADVYWKSVSLPYTEPGVRLLSRDRVEAFDTQMQSTRQELREAAQALDSDFDELKAEARNRLGVLYNPEHYPASVCDAFDVEWSFPSLEPPDYLKELNPQLYEREKARITAQFQEAVNLAQQAFTAQFSEMVTHLRERLQPDASGQRKIFRDSAVTNLREFFDSFRDMNVGGCKQLETLVEQAKGILAGLDPKDLRDMPALRQQIASELQGVEQALTPLVVPVPRRRILRPSTNGVASHEPAHQP